jgi:endonuclease/exonuclease/phosphatase family metal-dependent hydrolase
MWLISSRISTHDFISNPAPVEVPKGHFSVLSYNVNCDGYNNDVVDAVLKANADLVCMQETHGAWEDLFSEFPAILEQYPHRIWFEPPPSAGPGGTAILSKYQITKSQLINNISDVNGSWFPQWIGIVNVAETLVHLAIVHLRPPLDELGYQWSLSSPFTTNTVRVGECKYVLQTLFDQMCETQEPDGQIHNNVPLLIVGDFNENDNGPSVSYLAANSGPKGFAELSPSFLFKDAVKSFLPSQIETHRFPVPNFEKKILRSRLDHILYSKRFLRCTGCVVIPGYENASDHMPVFSAFEFI